MNPKARLAECSFLMTQDNDCCDNQTLGQELSVQFLDAGGGMFMVLKTDRWAVESPAELIEVLEKLASTVGGLAS